ncbi:MAG: hypothetical protein MI741_22775, partial [Rhodospirillales bacterium]|nr:hypothetical protein [Rhodospirillales bacterium]
MTKQILAVIAAGLLMTQIVAADDDESRERKNVDFDINATKVTPSEDFAVMVSVLGSAITSGNRDVPVTVQLQIGDQVIEPWGDYDDSSAGNVNDPEAPTRNHIVDEIFEVDGTMNVNVSVSARSWVRGSVHIEADATDDTQQVIVLRNGDAAPNIDGYSDQADAEAFLAPYIDFDNGVMTLDENQAIYLFELGTSRMSSSAADFQDLVVLVTLGKTTADFAEATDIEPLYD